MTPEEAEARIAELQDILGGIWDMLGPRPGHASGCDGCDVDRDAVLEWLERIGADQWG